MTQNLKSVFLTLALTLLSLTANAGSLSELFVPMTENTKTLLAENSTPEVQSFWLLSPDQPDHEVVQNQFEISPGSKLKVDLNPWREVPWIRILTPSKTLNFFLAVGVKFIPIPLGSSNVLVLKRGPIHATLHLANLTSEKQKFAIQGLDNGATYLRGELNPFETRTLVWRGTASALKIGGELRLAAWYENSLTREALFFAPVTSDFASQLVPVEAGARFVLANSARDQSFIVHLQDPKLIEQARAQIRNPQKALSRMLIARVTSGTDHLNFDKFGAFGAPWSWHVEEVFRFADFGSIDCDGSPQQLEASLSWWLAARQGLICFWDYKVKEEL